MFVVTLLLLLIASIGSVVFFTLLVAHDYRLMRQTLAASLVEVGDGVVYRKQKESANPGPRAYDIHRTEKGDTYRYFVDKFWTVENVYRDGRVLVTTRTGKHHFLQPDDPNLRKAGLMVRLRHRSRFPDLHEAA